jgi:hypothetical protein
MVPMGSSDGTSRSRMWPAVSSYLKNKVDRIVADRWEDDVGKVIHTHQTPYLTGNPVRGGILQHECHSIAGAVPDA